MPEHCVITIEAPDVFIQAFPGARLLVIVVPGAALLNFLSEKPSVRFLLEHLIEVYATRK